MSQPAGWYYAQGDPPGTQRFWDGSQWVGGPQAAQGGSEPGAFGSYGGGGGSGTMVPAEWATRALAYLIDAGIVFGGYVVIYIVTLIFGAISDTLAFLVLGIGWLGIVGFSIWNMVIQQGQTGQSIGKKKMGIKLVADATHQPVGAGMAFVRILVGSLFGLLCGIGTFVDLLWPLFDQDKKRLTDKILNFSVVTA